MDLQITCWASGSLREVLTCANSCYFRKTSKIKSLILPLSLSSILEGKQVLKLVNHFTKSSFEKVEVSAEEF